MESAGPTTRSRARGGSVDMPASAAKAPSTRKKAAPRSTRKSFPARMPPASPPKPAGREAEMPVEDADDTAAAADIPEATAHADAHMRDDSATQESMGTPAPPASATIGGLAPMMDQGATPGANPAGYGPSPVMPIKLDSLWTPGTAQHTSSSPYAVFSPLAAPEGSPAAEAQGSGLAQDNSTIDLASMFISTPAAAPGSSSPIEGVIAADEAPAAALAPATEPIAAWPQQETPSANDSVLMGSPAPPGAFAFAELAAAAGPTPGSPAALPPAGSTGATPEPSAPLLPQGQPGTAAIQATPGTPGWSVDTDLPPPGSPSFDTQAQPTPAVRATPGSVRGPAPKSAAKKTPGGTARKSATPGPSPSPLLDSNSPMPPAGPPVLSDMESPMPTPGSPMLVTDDDDDLPPAGSPMLSVAGTPAAAAASSAKAKTPLSVQRGSAAAAEQQQQDTEMGEPAAQQQQQAAPLQKYEAFEAVLLESAAKEVEFLEGQLQAVPTDSASTEQEAFARSPVQQQEDVSMMDTAGSEEASMEAAAAAHGTPQAAAAGMDLSFGSPAAAACGDSPAAMGFAGAETCTPHNTPAAATLGGDGTVTSPGARYRSSSATTAAPPKSALAKPKSGSSSAAPKHAHVVVPDAASPKTTPAAKGTAGRHMPGSAAARFTDTQKQQAGGSPGHTPFPSKAKVRAATAAATSAAASRSAAAAAGTSKGPSHKKEMALAAAHSALKHYSKAVGDAAEGSPDGGRWQASGSPSPTIPHVSSRLMQPTASSSAKSRYSGASDGPDAHMWSPPAEAAAAEPGAGASKPRLASKIVVPSPAAAAPAPSLKALKRSIKSKVAEKAQATLQEGMADAAAADVVRSSKLGGSSSASSKALKASQKAAAAAAEEELDLDTYDDEEEGYYEEEYYEEEEEEGGDVNALADSLAGLSVKPIRVAQPQGLLKGVVAPAGRHFKFDEAGNAMETPVSRQRRAPRHTKFDDDGNPIPAQPRWR